jgi:hypothetical protein
VANGQTQIAKDGVGVGYLVFTSLSMKIFSARIDAIPLGMLTLLAMSAFAFVARFRGVRLIVVPFLFLALTIILITPVTTDPFTLNFLPIGGSRYMGVIAIVPAIHILYELLEPPAAPRRETWRRLIPFVVQAAVLALAVIIRGAAGYFLLAIGVVSLVVLWRRRSQGGRPAKIFKSWTALAATFAVVLGVIVASLPSEYVSTGRLFGNFWHCVFTSITLHPSWPYGNLREMFPCTNAFPEGLGPRFDAAGYCAYFAARPDYHPTPQQLNADMRNILDGAYERVLRDAFFKVVKAYPHEIFETFAYEKSKLVRQTVLEAIAMNAPRDPPPQSGCRRSRQ